jgi:F-type H+-transporting ATPase subunit c
VINRSVLSTLALVLVAGAFAPLYAQGPVERYPADLVRWSIITGGFALAIAAGLAALAQGRAVSSATEAIARNPGAAGDIRGALLLGLVLIESLAIYVFVISLILFFVKPFST